MSKNRPQVKARDGKFKSWNFFRRTNSKRSFLLSFKIPAAVVMAAVGLTGLEPVTLRLSSACSNQLSYRPWVVSAAALWRQGDSNP